jgi:hypothetical protein
MSERLDDELLVAVGRTVKLTEAVPAEVVRQAKAAFAWRDIAVTLAMLEDDSLIDDDGLARVRSARHERRISFQAAAGSMKVSIIDGGHRLVGQVEPMATGVVQLRQPSGTQTTAADRFGQFLFESIHHGPVSIRWQPDDSSAGFETEWVTI